MESTKDEKYRFVWIDATVMGNKMCTDTNEKQENDIVKELINQVEYFKSKVEKLETDLREQRLRHGTTIFKIINQNQMLIRGVKKTFLEKVFQFYNCNLNQKIIMSMNQKLLVESKFT